MDRPEASGSLAGNHAGRPDHRHTTDRAGDVPGGIRKEIRLQDPRPDGSDRKSSREGVRL